MTWLAVYALVCLTLGMACTCCGITECTQCCNEGATQFDIQLDISGIADGPICFQCDADQNGSFAFPSVLADFLNCLQDSDTWSGGDNCYGAGLCFMSVAPFVESSTQCGITVGLDCGSDSWTGEHVFNAPDSCLSISSQALTETSAGTANTCDWSAIVVELTLS